MSWLDTLAFSIILGLAVFRAVRFWLKDVLIANQRIWVLNAVLGRRPNTWREKLHEFIGCHHCLSGQIAWISTTVIAQITSVPLPGLVWLAAWAVESFAWHRLEDKQELAITGRIAHREDKYGQ